MQEKPNQSLHKFKNAVSGSEPIKLRLSQPVASLARRPSSHVDEEEGICRCFFFHSSSVSLLPNHVPLARVKIFFDQN